MKTNFNILLVLQIIVFVIFLCVNTTHGLRRFWNGRRHLGTVGEPGVKEPNAKKNDHIYHIKEQWMLQSVDNFNKSNPTTWPNRYFANNLFYQPGGPVFLLLRGEDRASAAFMVNGAWVMYGKIFGARLFQLEHRFYGKSFPTRDLSTENLKYLSSKQALADTANFIETINKQYNITANTPWIIFGGSYAGALSIWMAEKYPDLVTAVVSSSGPVSPTVNYIKYLQTVSSVLHKHSQECAANIKSAFNTIKSLLNGSVGEQASLYNQLQLCDTAIHATVLDKANLMYTLTGDLMYAVQYNLDNTNNNYASIEVVCNIMTNPSIGTTLDRFVQVNNLLLQELGDDCVDYKYNQVIHQLRNTSIGASVSFGGDRQWTYQTCNEFGYFQTSQSKFQIFGNEFPLGFFINQCEDVFGPRFALKNVQKRVKKTNTNYGALKPKVNNVLAVQGTADPWHLVGYYKNMTEGMNALFIPGTAHCADMYEPLANDTAPLKNARNIIIQFINDILNKNYTNPKPQQNLTESVAGSANGTPLPVASVNSGGANSGAGYVGFNSPQGSYIQGSSQSASSGNIFNELTNGGSFGGIGGSGPGGNGYSENGLFGGNGGGNGGGNTFGGNSFGGKSYSKNAAGGNGYPLGNSGPLHNPNSANNNLFSSLQNQNQQVQYPGESVEMSSFIPSGGGRHIDNNFMFNNGF